MSIAVSKSSENQRDIFKYQHQPQFCNIIAERLILF